MSDKELKELIASLAVESQKTIEAIGELRQAQAKTDKQLAKTDEQLAKTDEQLAKTDKQLAKTDEQLRTSQKDVDNEIKKLSKYIGNIGTNQGDVAEEFFVNSLSSTLELGNIHYDELYKNMYKKTKKAEGEFDIVLINGKDIAIIETKYKAHLEDLQDLIHKKHDNFKKLYPQYNNYNHHLGLASFNISDDIKQEALRNKVMILQRKGDIVQTFLP